MLFQFAFTCLYPCQEDEVVGQSRNQQQRLNAPRAMTSMQVQPQVLTFYIPEAFFDLHAPFINRDDFRWTPLAVLQVARQQPRFTFTSGGLPTELFFGFLRCSQQRNTQQPDCGSMGRYGRDCSPFQSDACAHEPLKKGERQDGPTDLRQHEGEVEVAGAKRDCTAKCGTYR